MHLRINSKFEIRSPKLFTLIELLVVVAIIAVLIAVLLPSLTHARDVARKAVCAANERQVGTAVTMYIDQNIGRLPPAFLDSATPFNDVLAPYLGSGEADHGGKVFICPADPYVRFTWPGAPYELNPKRSYTINVNLADTSWGDPLGVCCRIPDVTDPAATLYMAEWHSPYNKCNVKDLALLGSDCVTNPLMYEHPDWWPHLRTANFLHVDAHVEALAPMNTMIPRNRWSPY